VKRSNAAPSADDRLLRRMAWRVGLQTGIAVAVTVLVLAGLSLFVVLRSQNQAQDRLMDQAMARADDTSDPPAGTWLVLQREGHVFTSPGIPAGLPDLAELAHTAAERTTRTTEVTVHGRDYRVRSEPRGPDGAVQVVLDLQPDHEETQRLLQALLLAGAAGLVLAAATGSWLARRSVVPLADALALQRRFVADAGHELRTPVTLLSTRAQLLRRRLRGDTDTRWLADEVDGLVRDAGQLTAILEDLLLAADPRDHATNPLDLALLVTEVADAIRPDAESRGVALSIEAPDEGALVAGSTQSLRRAITALLDNAVRHATSTVLVEVRNGGQVEVEVADDGAGIAAEVLPRIFERFATGRDDRVAGRRRYGLGLALVSDIVARHGGTITAVNDQTAGARFKMTLPRLQKTPPRSPDADQPTPQRGSD
jgi:two-component system OmpR family sensor kinase